MLGASSLSPIPGCQLGRLGGAGGGYLQEGCTYVHIYRQQGVGRGPQHGEEQNKVHLYRLDPALAAGGQGLGPSRGCHARG